MSLEAFVISLSTSRNICLGPYYFKEGDRFIEVNVKNSLCDTKKYGEICTDEVCMN